MIHYEDDQITLHHGDALEVARSLPAASVRTIVTSPPYYGLRDYGEDGQIGAEGSVGEYVARMVELFRELRRVLADDGTLWLNLGDSYGSAGGDTHTGFNARYFGKENVASDKQSATAESARSAGAIKRDTGLRPKNLLGVPWRVAFALQEDGWILRSDIIWAKPNPMPESVTDRPTKAHEYLFLFAKSPRYYYDAEAIAEVAHGREGGPVDRSTNKTHSGGTGLTPHRGLEKQSYDTRNKRTVWEVGTIPFPGSHFAVYPPELIRPCIRAGSAQGDTVLDPFSGSGTTGAVATFEGRKYIGIDLNAEYLDLSLRTRFQQPTLNMEAS